MGREMKDSGIEWIGEIPKEWELIKLKYIFKIIGGNGFPDKLQGNINGDYPFCKVSDINSLDTYVYAANNYVTTKIVTENNFNIIPENSLIIAKIGAALLKNHRKINKVRCCIDNNIQALVLKRTYNIKYAYYISKCIDMAWFNNGSTVPSVNNEKLLNSYIPMIDSITQQKIADFLDSQCSGIDSVLDRTRATIEEYKKLKQAVITQAVTKGVRGKRPMKDSGIEWIGEIPEKWKCTYLKNLCVMRSGKNLISEQIADQGNYPVYGGNGVRGYFSEYNIDDEIILVGRQGALCGNVHKVKGKIWATEHAVVTKNKENTNINYLFYMLVSMNLNQYASNTAAQPGLAVSEILSKKALIPSEEEQQEIADYLDKTCSEIDTLISQKEQYLVELENYKKSLIYEYVTGKREV